MCALGMSKINKTTSAKTATLLLRTLLALQFLLPNKSNKAAAMVPLQVTLVHEQALQETLFSIKSLGIRWLPLVFFLTLVDANSSAKEPRPSVVLHAKF